MLDGDDVRTHLSKGLGFSTEDRDTNIDRIGYVARLLARNGVAVVTRGHRALCRDPRRGAPPRRRRASRSSRCSRTRALEALTARDVKGLYRSALAGEIPHFTGVSDPYEAPETPDVVVHSDRETVEESLDRILAALASRGLVGAWAEERAS